jgi:hypothetical protein
VTSAETIFEIVKSVSLNLNQLNDFHFSAAVKQLLNLNQPLSQSLAVEPVWKLLVLDAYGQDIISPLISVKQLRELGVTLHL